MIANKHCGTPDRCFSKLDMLWLLIRGGASHRDAFSCTFITYLWPLTEAVSINEIFQMVTTAAPFLWPIKLI